MKYKYTTSIFTIVFVLFVSVMSIITPDKETSDLESRSLQVMPTIENLKEEDNSYRIRTHLKGLLDGEVFGKWDSYFSDHIYARNSAVNAYVAMQDILGQKYINGAYIAEDEYIISPTEFVEKKESDLVDSAEHFNKIAAKFEESETYVVNLPRKHMVYEEKMPISSYIAPENSYIDTVLENMDKNKINVLDTRSIMDSSKDLYYKTDHHWNMNGVYESYNYIISNMISKFPQIGEPESKDMFDIKTYSSSFIGSDARKVGKLVDYADDIEVYNNKEFKKYKVLNKKGEISLIKEELLTDNNPNNDYSAYLGGDNSELLIENYDAKNDLKIVMIGDSMDNALIPLMAPHFKELYSFDQREYTGFKGNIDSIVSKINPDIIMFIGMSNNFIDGANSSVFKWNI